MEKLLKFYDFVLISFILRVCPCYCQANGVASRTGRKDNSNMKFSGEGSRTGPS